MAAQCRAKAKATGQRCRRKAIAGGKTCTVHGSSTKAAKAAAARNVANDKALVKATLYGEPVDGIDGLTNLAMMLARQIGITRWYQSEVGKLKTLTEVSERGESAALLVELYAREREIERRITKDANDLDLGRELNTIAQQWVDQQASLIDGVLRAFGHDPDDPEVREVVRTQLELIPGGQVA